MRVWNFAGGGASYLVGGRIKTMRALRAKSRKDHGHRQPWNRWAMFAALLMLLCAPFLLDLNLPGHGRRSYRPPTAVTGVRLPEISAYISIDKQMGFFRISSGEETSMMCDEKELRQAVSAIAASFPDRAFTLCTDRDTQYRTIDRVLTILADAGVQKVFFYSELPSQG